MSVVTALRNVSGLIIQPWKSTLIGIQFVRLLGGTLSLAIGSTIMYVHAP